MLLATNTPPPPEEYRQNLYAESLALKERLLVLLADARKHKVRRIWKGKLKTLEAQYDSLFTAFVNYDTHCSEYADMTSNPFMPHLENLSNPERESIVNQLEMSSRALFAQWESMRMLLQDISSQITALQNQVNNNVVLLVALLSLIVALASLWISVIMAATPDTIPPLLN